MPLLQKGHPTSGATSTSHGHGGGSFEGGEDQSDCGGKRNASFPFPERGQRCHFHESYCPSCDIYKLCNINNIFGENSTVVFSLSVEFLTPLFISSLRTHQEIVQMAGFLHKTEDKY
ncbi:hypothetical protein CAJAP_10558 [Camponotus japonicus]